MLARIPTPAGRPSLNSPFPSYLRTVCCPQSEGGRGTGEFFLTRAPFHELLLFCHLQMPLCIFQMPEICDPNQIRDRDRVISIIFLPWC
ncbi:Hypothetical protein NTJ_04984 [Nesidiocoris tenuis]|uniref:Uncharacterized protein n=1 Tax=Nesidiocoris tenuis TaxID=355587 RepID=A0ABN7AMR4_9HEMI|nr:Hypothetical protein NTJ_04984 [Nesidiocoris tenuis]